jgi:hypothetical protein
MLNKYKILTIALLGIFLLLYPTAIGQIVYKQPSLTSLQLIYTGWTLENDTLKTDISQLMLPLGGYVALKDNMDANIYIANSSTQLVSPEQNYTLSGTGDIRIQVNHSFYNDALLLSGGINLPVGKKKLSLSNELIIMDYLSKDYLSFPMNRFGEGFGLNLLLGGAKMFGEFKCGGGLLYQFNGSYEPYNNGLDYNPGDMFSINAGTEWQKDSYILTGDIIGTIYTTDKLDNKKAFKQSPQADLRLGGIYKKESYNLGLNLRYLLRGRNTRYGQKEIIVEQLKVYGNEFDISGKASLLFGDNWTFNPLVELKIIAENEDNFGNSKIIGTGASLDKQIDKHVAYGFGFEYLLGTTNAGDIDLTGYRLTSHLTATF